MSFDESEYAEQALRSRPSRAARDLMASDFARPCSGGPFSRPVYIPFLTSETVPSAPVSPKRRATMVASSTGVAVTSQTCCPASRWAWASARDPGMSLSTMLSLKIVSPKALSSSTLRPCTKESAASVTEAISSRSSDPLTTNLICLTAKPAISGIVKYLRLAKPTAM